MFEKILFSKTVIDDATWSEAELKGPGKQLIENHKHICKYLKDKNKVFALRLARVSMPTTYVLTHTL